MNGAQQQTNPTLTRFHLLTWSRADAQFKTTHSVPAAAWTWSTHDIIRVYGIT